MLPEHQTRPGYAGPRHSGGASGEQSTGVQEIPDKLGSALLERYLNQHWAVGAGSMGALGEGRTSGFVISGQRQNACARTN